MSTEGVPPRLLRRAPGVGVHALPAVRAPARSASTTTTSASRRCSSRSTRSTPSGRSQDEVAEPGYYAAIARLGHPQRAHRRARSRRSTATRSPAHDDARLVVDFSLGGLAIDHGRTVPMRAQLVRRRPGRRPGRDRRRGRAARRAHRVRRRPLAPDALVRPPADGRRQPARVRLHPPHDAAPLRADVRRARPSRARRSSCAWASRCGASTRPRRNLHADCGTEPRALRPPPGRDPPRVARALRPHRGRGRRRASSAPSSPPRSTTR